MLLAFFFLLSIDSRARSQCSGGIPASEVSGFLTAHNRLRQTISAGNYAAKGKWMPAAKIPIPNLTWDCGLERSAQSVANTCRFDHSEYSKVFGENLFMTAGGSFSGQGKAASDDWESEFQVYGWPGVRLTKKDYESEIGHATQMAWAKTTKMGCGMAMCQGKRRVMVVCHYLDAGNYIGRNVYEPAGETPKEIVVDVGDDTGSMVSDLFKNWYDLERSKHI